MRHSNRRTRVLFVTASYPTEDDRTSGVFVREHARAAARRCDVAVLHLHRRDGGRPHRAMRVEDEPLPTWRVEYPRRPLPVSYAGNLAAAAVGYRAVRRWGFRPDLLHAHFFLAGVPAVLVGAAAGLPVVTTEHWSVFLPDDPMRLDPVARRLARFAFARSSAVLPVSEALAVAIGAGPGDARYRVVPNAVDTDLFHPSAVRGKPGHRLLAVSGLYGAKGYETLLPAIARLRARGVPVTLDIVGDGEGRTRYEALAEELGLASVIRFHGERTKAEIAEFMRAADLFVLASVYENNPCAVLEALVSGLPVVATRVGGVPEVVSAGRGLLAAPRDPDDLADKIEQALGSSKFERNGIARDAAAAFGLDSIGETLAAVYSQALAGPRSR